MRKWEEVGGECIRKELIEVEERNVGGWLSASLYLMSNAWESSFLEEKDVSYQVFSYIYPIYYL